MRTNQYRQALDALRNRAEALSTSRQDGHAPGELVQDLLQQLSAVTEALSSAEKEIHTKHTETLIAREDAEQERLRYQELFDLSPEAHLVTDALGIVRQANRAAVILLNLTPQYLHGKPLVNFVSSDDRSSFRQQLRQVHVTGTTQRWEMQLKPREQGLIDVEASVAYVLHPHETQHPELRWQIRDISQRKRLEAAEREQFFRATFEQTALGMGHVGANGQWLRVNHKLTEMLGYSVEELTSKTFADITFQDDVLLSQEIHHQLLSGEKSSLAFEKRYQRKDGGIIWVRVACSAVRTPAGEFMYNIFVAEDITERLKLEQWEREQARILAVIEERQRLARDLHDAVTQTLFTISIMSEAMPRLWEQLPVKMREQLDVLHRMTRGALAEMRILLMELRPEQIERVELSTHLQQLADAVRGRKQMTVQLKLDLQARVPPDVHTALYRIAQEAINNIVKHARATALIITLQTRDYELELSIHDNGSGFEVSKAASGMGLQNMRERAEAIGAQLTIDSQPGKGTQLLVTWKQQRP
jgi:PAS domain S-box-containing protein